MSINKILISIIFIVFIKSKLNSQVVTDLKNFTNEVSQNINLNKDACNIPKSHHIQVLVYLKKDGRFDSFKSISYANDTFTSITFAAIEHTFTFYKIKMNLKATILFDFYYVNDDYLDFGVDFNSKGRDDYLKINNLFFTKPIFINYHSVKGKKIN